VYVVVLISTPLTMYGCTQPSIVNVISPSFIPLQDGLVCDTATVRGCFVVICAVDKNVTDTIKDAKKYLIVFILFFVFD